MVIRIIRSSSVFCLLFPASPVVYVLNKAVRLFPFLQFQISSEAAEPLFSDKIPPEPCAIETWNIISFPKLMTSNYLVVILI